MATKFLQKWEGFVGGSGLDTFFIKIVQFSWEAFKIAFNEQ